MYKLTSPSVACSIMQKYGFHTMKAFGQNFLCDEHYVNGIVDCAELTKDDIVIEVGPGIGTLTQVMCQRAKHVYAIEIDKKLIPILKDTLTDFDNVTVINEDVLDVDFKAFLGDEMGSSTLKIVSNLPYYITTPVIMRFVEENIPFKTMVLMIQAEVADRLAAKPGTKDYGVLSVMLQCVCDIEFMLKVPPNVFVPKPQVSSGVVRLTRRENKIEVSDEELFRQVVKGAFTQRRKTLLNSLSSVMSISKDVLTEVLNEVNIEPTERCENLTLEQFAALTEALKAKVQKQG